MSYPFFPVNKSKQQEMEKATKDMAKDLKPQEHTGNSPMQMNSEEYAEFLETQKRAREARIEVERERRKAANMQIYTALVLGLIGFAVGFYSFDVGGSLLGGWFAVICSALGMISLIRHFFGPYGVSIGLWGIIGFGLCFFGVMSGFGAIGTAITP